MTPTAMEDIERRLQEQNIQTAQMLGSAVAMRDHQTATHSHRVALYAGGFGEALGLDPSTIRDLIAGAFLHDLGKIIVPDSILLKPGPLSPREQQMMQEHCRLGAELLSELPAFCGAVPIVRHHHERYDGTGYPDRLVGTIIPLIARAFAIVDVFDALVSARAYKPAFQLSSAIGEIESSVGSQFDPEVAKAFIHLAPASHNEFGHLPEDALKSCLIQMRRHHFGV